MRSTTNLGAYNSQFGQNIQTVLFSKVLTGVYDIPVADLHVQAVYTNTTPVDAYRGRGAARSGHAAVKHAGSWRRGNWAVSPFELRART